MEGRIHTITNREHEYPVNGGLSHKSKDINRRNRHLATSLSSSTSRLHIAEPVRRKKWRCICSKVVKLKAKKQGPRYPSLAEIPKKHILECIQRSQIINLPADLELSVKLNPSGLAAADRRALRRL